MSADKRSLNLDYLPHLRRVLTSPLRQHGQDGVRDVIDAMTQYDLLRDDVDAIAEISQWPGMPDAMAGVESKVRVRRTRTGPGKYEYKWQVWYMYHRVGFSCSVQ